MAQKVRAIAANTNILSLIPRPYIVGRKTRIYSCKFTSDLHTCTIAHVYTHTYFFLLWWVIEWFLWKKTANDFISRILTAWYELSLTEYLLHARLEKVHWPCHLIYITILSEEFCCPLVEKNSLDIEHHSRSKCQSQDTTPVSHNQCLLPCSFCLVLLKLESPSFT